MCSAGAGIEGSLLEAVVDVGQQDIVAVDSADDSDDLSVRSILQCFNTHLCTVVNYATLHQVAHPFAIRVHIKL